MGFRVQGTCPLRQPQKITPLISRIFIMWLVSAELMWNYWVFHLSQCIVFHKMIIRFICKISIKLSRYHFSHNVVFPNKCQTKFPRCSWTHRCGLGAIMPVRAAPSPSLLAPLPRLQPSASGLDAGRLSCCLRQWNSSGVCEGERACVCVCVCVCVWNQTKLRLRPWTMKPDGGAQTLRWGFEPTWANPELDERKPGRKPDDFFITERRKETVSLSLILTFLRHRTWYLCGRASDCRCDLSDSPFPFARSCGITHPLLSNWQLECFSPSMYLMGFPAI